MPWPAGEGGEQGFLLETVALLIVGCCLAAKMFELEVEQVELIVIDVACSKLVGVTSNEKVYIPQTEQHSPFGLCLGIAHTILKGV